MSKLIPLALALLLPATATTALAQPPVAPAASTMAHASRTEALLLLRREGILSGTTRVSEANWNGFFWLISLRHSKGHISNWTVDATATNYGYVCQH